MANTYFIPADKPHKAVISGLDMPPSQLKRLKASLREQGVVGPAKSKKQKKQARKLGTLRDSRIQRNAALQGIREELNPFEVKTISRTKYDFASNKDLGAKVAKGVISRPGLTRGLAEENRRKTLLVEIRRRKKVGGILDRRFGEYDLTMTPEEKALERFVKERQQRSKKGSSFNLEDVEEDDQLTHFGQSLSIDEPVRDDFREADLDNSNEDEPERSLRERPQKRRRLSDTDPTYDNPTEERNARYDLGKTKKEVMNEIIAKSKLHKYERQQAKEDDDELRAELDKDLLDLFALMRRTPRQASPSSAPPAPNADMNPDRLSLHNGKERSRSDREYDERLRQMAMDGKAKPTVRTLTDEEKARQEANRLKELEERRVRRMRRELGDRNSEENKEVQDLDGDEDRDRDEADNFGLGPGLTGKSQTRQLDVEDEDDFIMEDDLIASGSNVGMLEARNSREPSVESRDDDDDQKSLQTLLSEGDAVREWLSISKEEYAGTRAKGPTGDLAYTYKCPESHGDLLAITNTMAIEHLPTAVQRIRALYHPKLASENKTKLGIFAAALVDHISYLANQPEHPPFIVLEALTRHIHSLAKTFPEAIGRAFRSHLKDLHSKRPNAPTSGDLIILTAIASIFPTSDHFHQIVTPAILCMTRYLEQKIPQSLSDLVTGTYIVTLCLHYQRLSKRYIPEVVNYVFNTLWALKPGRTKHFRSCFPHHNFSGSLRHHNSALDLGESRQLSFWDAIPDADYSTNQILKSALVDTHITLVDNMVDKWAKTSAFCEVFGMVYTTLGHYSSASGLNPKTKAKIRNASTKLHEALQKALAARKPLLLHSHRPLAIKTSIPKFEETYNPEKHYDHDRDRAKTSKLKAEHKRERKGALRELRKDANFIARESLREKKERDNAYQKKYRRLVAEIQGEEGREAKNYVREKRMRTGRK